MDWDDEIFDRNEFETHLDSLAILQNHTVDELLKRTTRNTRTGNEFSFILTDFSIGVVAGGEYYSGFKTQVHRDGPMIHDKDPQARDPSSYWFRFE